MDPLYFLAEFLGLVAGGGHGVCSSLWFSAFHSNAERLLAKAGGSKRKLRGLPTLGMRAKRQVERAERSEGLHKRQREDWGCGWSREWGWSPSVFTSDSRVRVASANDPRSQQERIRACGGHSD